MPEIAINWENKYPAFFERFGEEIVGTEQIHGDGAILLRPGKIREVVQYLKDESSPRFEMMMDLFAMDYLKYEPEKPERFAVVYLFYSFVSHEHFRLKVYLPEAKAGIDSIHDIYAAANWNEREAWDLFGITFAGHPNLVRILCHTEFVGHPLRKDYPSDQYQRLKIAAPSTGF